MCDTVLRSPIGVLIAVLMSAGLTPGVFSTRALVAEVLKRQEDPNQRGNRTKSDDDVYECAVLAIARFMLFVYIILEIVTGCG